MTDESVNGSISQKEVIWLIEEGERRKRDGYKLLLK